MIFQITDKYGWKIHPYCAAWGGLNPENGSPLGFGNYTTGDMVANWLCTRQ